MNKLFLILFLLSGVASADQDSKAQSAEVQEWDWKCPGCKKRFYQVQNYKNHVSTENLSLLACYGTCADIRVLSQFERFEPENVKVPHKISTWRRVFLRQK